MTMTPEQLVGKMVGKFNPEKKYVSCFEMLKVVLSAIKSGEIVWIEYTDKETIKLTPSFARFAEEK